MDPHSWQLVIDIIHLIVIQGKIVNINMNLYSTGQLYVVKVSQFTIFMYFYLIQFVNLYKIAKGR